MEPCLLQKSLEFWARLPSVSSIYVSHAPNPVGGSEVFGGLFDVCEWDPVYSSEES